MKDMTTDTSVGLAIKREMMRFSLDQGSFNLADICEATGFSITTVITYLNRLRESQYVVELEKQHRGARGRMASRFAVNPDLAYFVGVEVGKNKLAIAVMNFVGEIVVKKDFADYKFDNTRENLEYVIDSLQTFIRGLDGSIDIKRIASVCLALSGRVNTLEGTSASVYYMEEVYGRSLADVLTERLGYKVFLENDTKAITYGEYTTRFRDKYSNLLYINIGWGLGLGMIIGGELFYGRDGYSGEIGHIHRFDNNIMCHCGKKGCLETEVSGYALRRKLEEHVRQGEQSLLSPKIRAGREITLNDLLRAIDETDLLTLELLDDMGKLLGRHIAELINIFNPEAIVVGGALMSSDGNYMMSSIKVNVGKFALRLNTRNVDIVPSELKQEACVTGACLLGRRRSMAEMNL